MISAGCLRRSGSLCKVRTAKGTRMSTRRLLATLTGAPLTGMLTTLATLRQDTGRCHAACRSPRSIPTPLSRSLRKHRQVDLLPTSQVNSLASHWLLAKHTPSGHVARACGGHSVEHDASFERPRTRPKPPGERFRHQRTPLRLAGNPPAIHLDVVLSSQQFAWMRSPQPAGV
jgi:hypothetical protein